MNELYLGCVTCRTMTEAGYRWAYWTLEHTGVVRRGAVVDTSSILSAHDYWAAPADEDAAWLRDRVLPTVKDFLKAHGSHQVMFGDIDDLWGNDYLSGVLTWLELGSDVDPTPRWFVEVLGARTWAEVVAWTREHRAPWWWQLGEYHDVARVRFGELVNGKTR